MYKGLFNMLIEAYILCSFTYYICFKKILSIRWKKRLSEVKKKRKSYYPYFLYFLDSENNYSFTKVMT